jgi:hypothetical protein
MRFLVIVDVLRNNLSNNFLKKINIVLIIGINNENLI